MPQSFFHPAVLLLCWLCGVVALQSLGGMVLLGTLLALGGLAMAVDRHGCRRMLRRIRYLLLAVLVLFGFFTPGTALLQALPTLSPSVEGLALAWQHGGRLMAVVLAVVLLRARLSADAIVSGAFHLLRPLVRWGLPAQRLALRLLLVLREVDQPPAGGWRGWLTAVDEGQGDGELPVVHLAQRPLAMADRALMLLAPVLMAGVLWW